MNNLIAFFAIFLKDIKTYYLKPPNISWGIIFPFAWAGMFFIRTGGNMMDVMSILLGIMAISILFGTTSMLSVTITFEKKSRTFDRILLSPIPLGLIMFAKTSGAILFGIVNAFVPYLVAGFFVNLSHIHLSIVMAAIVLISIASTFMGLFIATSVSEVFEAQTFSNFFRFPMIFLCGLFFPISKLPLFLRPLSYIMPLTYGVDILHGAINHSSALPYAFDFAVLFLFCAILFYISLYNIKKRWVF
ncbi:MAG TPA: ABC transporter permease [Syntrophorhabdaceae bacterium]|nr:ABC transporter permease [Syntrophorhabdaceae bacterium]